MSTVTSSLSPQIAELFDRYVIPNYGRFPVTLARGEGSLVWDDAGNQYLDFVLGVFPKHLHNWQKSISTPLILADKQ